MNAKTARLAFVASIPVMAGYLVLGAGFGVLLQDRGHGFFWAFLMSLSIYAGSLQYASLDLISGGASLITTALMTLMINARHFFYGLSMLDRYQDAGKEKPYLIFSLTDETYSLMCAPVPEGADPRRFRLLVSVFDHCYWVLGSVIGGLLGPVLPFNTKGLDFAMTALFTVIFLEQWLSSKNHAAALLGLGITAVCLAVLGPDRFVIPSMVLITLTLATLRRRLEVAEDER
ncbi:MAG: AzlC family ABC transporter permease [Oscillospiraceae bacterium]|nr:AzlC family ABC transporter permease [Oscillospiraceae bacterium]